MNDWISVSEIENYEPDDLYEVPVIAEGFENPLIGNLVGNSWTCKDFGGWYFGRLNVTHFFILPPLPLEE